MPLARPDTWSWSAEGTWFPNSPAWNVVLGLGWQALGFWGLFLVALASMALLFGLTMLDPVGWCAGLAHAARVRTHPAGSVVALSARATVVVHAFVIGAVLFAWWWGGIAGPAEGDCGYVGSRCGRPRDLALRELGSSVIHAHGSGHRGDVGGGLVGIARDGSDPATAPHRIRNIWAAAGLPRVSLRRRTDDGAGTRRQRDLPGPDHRVDLGWEAATLGRASLDPGRGGCDPCCACVGVWVVRLYRRYGRFDPRLRLVAPLGVFAVPVTIMGLGSIRFLVLGMLVILPVAAAAATMISSTSCTNASGRVEHSLVRSRGIHVRVGSG